jgi:hypothetical protein
MGEFTIKYWMAWAYGIIGTALISTFAVVIKRYKGMTLGMQALLRAQIYQMYNSYMALEYFPIHERENLDELFEQYKNTGGNGSVKDLVKRLYDLPTKPNKS